MPRPAVFRLQRDQRASGAYFTLVKGKKDPVFIGLGCIPEADAERCLDAVRQIDERGRLHAVLRLFRGDVVDGGREAGVRFLLSVGDLAAADEVLGADTVDHARMTLAEYVDQVYGPERQRKRPASWRTEERRWKDIKGRIGGLRLRDINEYVVADMLDGLTLKAGGEASYNTKRLHRSSIAAVLQFARRKGHLRRPMPQWFPLEGSSTRRLPEPEPLAPHEIEALLEGARQPKHRAMFAVGFGIGLRPSEVTRIDWSDVDWSVAGDGYRGALRVRGRKTDLSKAVVPLLPLARRELEAWWLACGRPAAGLAFPARGDEAYSEKNTGTFRRALANAARRAGLEKRVFPYLGRHSAATNLVEIGVPSATVAKVLRHTNPRMLEKNYDHTGALRAPGLDLVASSTTGAVAAGDEVEDTGWLELARG